MLIVTVECDLCGGDALGNRTEARESHGFARRKIDGAWKDVCASCLRQLDPKGLRRQKRKKG